MAGVGVRARAMPNSREKNISPSMSPSAADLTGLFGTIWVSRSMPVLGAVAGEVKAAARSAAPAVSRALSSGEMPAPGCRTLTRVMPMRTAMADTTTV